MLGVKELNIGKIILDMSEKVWKFAAIQTTYSRDPKREEVR